ncbi:hypothetical protein C0992_004217 [Termitomyces sp. T32_za158]|nr:hypothetical protein C0992_004217 [Termitomyces sp. T32_za158]
MNSKGKKIHVHEPLDLGSYPSSVDSWMRSLDSINFNPAPISTDTEGAISVSSGSSGSETLAHEYTAEQNLKSNSGPSVRKSCYAFYVVFSGRTLGIHEDWDVVHKATNGFSGACYRGYRSYEDACAAWTRACSQFAAPTPSTSFGNTRSPTERCSANQTSFPHQTSSTQRPSYATVAQRSAPLLEEEKYYVVIRGASPGVYLGRFAANQAVGAVTGGVMEQTATKGAANEMFVDAFMNREVMRAH